MNKYKFDLDKNATNENGAQHSNKTITNIKKINHPLYKKYLIQKFQP